MAAKTNSPAYYALLIGIDSYPEGSYPLNSCARDVREINKCLKENTVGTLHTTLLVAAAENDSSNPAADQEGWPNYDNVILALKQIVERAKEGDVIYIHYSGHGTKMPPIRRNVFSNRNAGDLALVLLQDTESGIRIRYLQGSQLARNIKPMVEKGLRVTLVLDCCNSGSVMRDDDDYDDDDDGGTRYLEYDANVDAKFPSEDYGEEDGLDGPALTLGILPATRQRTYRDASMLPNWMINPQGFSIIAACGPHEIARHVKSTSGKQHGCLSYFLIKAFMDSDPGGLQGQFENIYERVRTRFLQRYPMQNPMWYGEKQRDFFGIIPMSDAGSRPMYPVIRQPRGRWQLEGGLAHGISIGDQLDILELGCPAVVTKVRGLTSDLDVKSPPDVGRPKGWPARLRTKFSLHKYPIYLQIAPSDDVNLLEIQSKRPWLKILVDESELHNLHFFRVNSISAFRATSFEIRDASNEVFRYMEGEFPDLDLTLDAVEHLAKFHLFNELSNNSSPPPPCDIKLKDIETGNTFDPDTLVEARHGNQLNLTIDNRGTDILYVYLYNLLPRWDIENMLKGSYDVLYPAHYFNQEDTLGTYFEGQKTYKMIMSIPEDMIEQGQQEYVDIIKVLITKRPTSFQSWRLPKMGEAPSQKIPTLRGEDEEDMDSEYWSTFTFSIRVCKDNPVSEVEH